MRRRCSAWSALGFSVISAGLLAHGAPARAEIVRLSFGDDFGQGWMFLDNDGRCKVVTAGHVVKGANGKARPMLVLDTNGHEWTAGAPSLLSDDPDIAVVPIPAASTPRACGDGRLSAIGVARRVTNLTNATIRTTGQSEQRNVSVVRSASVIDNHGGSVFAVSQSQPGAPFAKGWSGSVVLDGEGPVGIVYEVSNDGTEAYAVRVDVIREMMAAAPVPDLRPATSTPMITVASGATVDPARGPNQILGDGSYWLVRPSKRSIIVDFDFPTPIQLQRVTLALDGAAQGQINAVDVSSKSTADDPEWTWANYCKTSDEHPSCRFLKRTVTLLRLRLQTTGDAPIAIRSVSFQ